MPILNLDTAGTLDIIIGQGQSFSIQIEHFEADGTTPLPITGTAAMKVIAQGKVIKTIAATVDSNSITIAQTDVQNTMPPGKHAYHIYADQAAGITLPLWKGTLTVNPYPA